MRVVLKRDKKTGSYHWKDFEISKGVIGWNVYKWNERFNCFINYEFSAATLAEVRVSLANYE